MLLHFSLLSAMCWMCVEAFYMYLAFVRVFRTTITHFFLKASCFGWGVPLMIVAVTAGVNTTDNYAPLGNGLCWLKGVTFYIAFVAPVCLVLLCNVISFVLVLRVILGLTNNKPNSTQTNQAVQKLRRAVGVVILLGLTWVFGFLAIDDTSRVVFNYLFAIFNSLQGLFIYLFYGVFNKDARAACKLWFRCCESKPSAETAMPVEAKRGTSVKETKDETPPLKSSTAETFLTSGASACASSTGDEITSV
nr:hypothetical protein BaRGS_002306 [Batillaria attramentaria]